MTSLVNDMWVEVICAPFKPGPSNIPHLYFPHLLRGTEDTLEDTEPENVAEKIKELGSLNVSKE